VIGVTYLAEYIDPRYGGLLTAAPIITTLSFLFTRSETSHTVTQSLVEASLYFAVPYLLFLASLYLLLNRLSFVPSLATAYVVWIAAVIVASRSLQVW
jgi:uncharacterized membrane protein (GlpM family)